MGALNSDLDAIFLAFTLAQQFGKLVIPRQCKCLVGKQLNQRVILRVDDDYSLLPKPIDQVDYQSGLLWVQS